MRMTASSTFAGSAGGCDERAPARGGVLSRPARRGGRLLVHGDQSMTPPGIAPLLIRDIMTPRPKTVGPKTPVRHLQRLFIAYGFNAFPVVDEAAALIGIVSKLDLLRVFGQDPQRRLPRLTVLCAEYVGDIMRRRVVTLAPDDPVAAAVDRMLAASLRSLPVVEGREAKAPLVGIVSRGDVLNALVLEPDAAETSRRPHREGR